MTLTLVLLAAPLLAQAPSGVGERLEALRAEAGVPALAAAWTTLDGLQGTWVAGTREAGRTERVTADDLWHLGSCTKSMTATLIALLVARGDLAWDTPLGEALPELVDEMDLDYGDVTLVELLGHRAGLAANPDIPYLAGLRANPAGLVEQRAGFTAKVLGTPPVHAPRGAFLYSNSGFVVAGHLAERATGKAWEELMRTLLFEPLGMTSASFGPPGLGDAGVTQPRGHDQKGQAITPGPFADNPPALGPAGTVHASLADWAKYARLHLAGARGDVQVGELTLTRATFARLHTGLSGPGQPYGYGWVVRETAWAGGDGKALWHNGSNTMWYCELWLGLERGVALLVATNQAGNGANRAVDGAVKLLIEELGPSPAAKER